MKDGIARTLEEKRTIYKMWRAGVRIEGTNKANAVGWASNWHELGEYAPLREDGLGFFLVMEMEDRFPDERERSHARNLVYRIKEATNE